MTETEADRDRETGRNVDEPSNRQNNAFLKALDGKYLFHFDICR